MAELVFVVCVGSLGLFFSVLFLQASAISARLDSPPWWVAVVIAMFVMSSRLVPFIFDLKGLVGESLILGDLALFSVIDHIISLVFFGMSLALVKSLYGIDWARAFNVWSIWGVACLAGLMIYAFIPNKFGEKGSPARSLAEVRTEQRKDFASCLEAAEQGSADAQYQLGNLYWGSAGVPQDYAKSMEWFQKSADQGFASSQYKIGVMYERGWGVAANLKEAIKWYQIAAEQGYPKAQYNLGVAYRDAPESEGQELAKTWFLKAAENGFVNAELNLGVMYQNGQGVEQDYQEAMRWFLRASEHGDAGAQNGVGWLYENGFGVSQDYAEAKKWYRLSAENGYAKARANLARFAQQGD